MIKIMKSGETPASELFARTASARDVSGTVAEIIANVRANGDAALCEYNAKFDRAEGVALEVTAEELDAAVKAVDPEFLRVLERASANIRAFHERQLQRDYILTRPDGSMLGQRIIPMQRVGLYIPGGTAAYPSSVLMNCIPAKIAGVDEIVMTTPASGGEVSPAILAAAKVAGVDRVFRVGGAQAVAALAYGTETIPRVDKIVGPGNAFVAEAKRQVFGQVAIDMIAGPSEILIVADKSADPAWLAADMLSQAEHDMLASAILLTDDITLAEQVQQELEKQCSQLPKAQIAGKSLMDWGAIVVVPNIMTAVAIANRVAPEHLELCVRDPWALLPHIRHAGAIFMGQHSPEPVGDYFAGPNHVLPTLRTARFSSALSVQNFCKKTSIVATSPAFLLENAPAIASLARLEGLEAHARSVEIRSKR